MKKSTKKKIVFAGPSQRMKDELEKAGLHVEWPTDVKDEEELAIDGTFYTGAGDWEKNVLIDLRKADLSTTDDVDYAISAQLVSAYEDWDVDEEVKLALEANRPGTPDASTLVADMQEAEKRLDYFSNVAEAVYRCMAVPQEKEDGVTVTLTAEKAERVKEILARAVPLLAASDIELVNDLIAEINRKLENN